MYAGCAGGRGSFVWDRARLDSPSFVADMERVEDEQYCFKKKGLDWSINEIGNTLTDE